MKKIVTTEGKTLLRFAAGYSKIQTQRKRNATDHPEVVTGNVQTEKHINHTGKEVIMKFTIDAAMAKRIFEQYSRDYYSIEGIESILDYYNEIDENMEFDAIAI